MQKFVKFNTNTIFLVLEISKTLDHEFSFNYKESYFIDSLPYCGPGWKQ